MQVWSDLHLEFRKCAPEDLGLRPLAPVLALVGDTGILGDPDEDSDGRVQLDRFLRWCSERWRRVLYVPGNHEFYDSDWDTATAELRGIAESLPNVDVLEKRRVDLDNGFSVLGTQLWSHVPEKSRARVEALLNDYHCVTLGGRPLRVADTNGWHREAVTWLEQEIERCATEGRRAVVLTHHSPMPPKRGAGCAWATDLRAMMRAPVVAWFWGHTHKSQACTVGDVLSLSNQLGYGDGRDCGFNPNYVFPLS
eukprot:m51a1_g12220 hypothetical protein (252) ;mRNA; r:33110-33865